MSYDDIEHLIILERKIKPSCKNTFDDHRCLEFGYSRLNEADQKEILRKYKISHPDKFLLESFAATSCFELNEQLRDKDIVEMDEYFSEYTMHLNTILDGLNPYSNSIVWRWHVPEEGYEFMKSNIGKTIQFPEFKSTSIKSKNDTTLLKIITSSNSNGKVIYPHLDASKSVEKEVLFKSDSKFKVVNHTSKFIELQELDNQNEMVDILLNSYYWEKEKHYTKRAHSILFGTPEIDLENLI